MRGATNIYIARGLDSGLIKIGRTGHVRGRVQTLAVTVEPMELLATLRGPRSLEGELHRRFAAALEPSRGREWFHDDGSILAFVATLPESQRGSRVFRPGAPRAYRRYSPAERAERRRIALDRYAERSAKIAAAHGHIAGQPCAKCRAAFERSFAASAARHAQRRADTLLNPTLSLAGAA